MTKRTTKRFDRKKEVRAIARERVGTVKAFAADCAEDRRARSRSIRQPPALTNKRHDDDVVQNRIWPL